ncbi:MAG: hypothetical protein WA152_01670 [Microgenomates group bacterium]
MEVNGFAPNRLFEQKAKELGLNSDEKALAFVFWSAFQKAVSIKDQGDEESNRVRNQILIEGFIRIGAQFKKITLNSDRGKVPFYTVVFKGNELISHGDTQYTFRPHVDAPQLSVDHNTCQVYLDLDQISKKIITGAASMHTQINSGMRSDLKESSVTMRDHFIQAILSAADSQS